jgi:DNA-directed RNA polymerase subunit RPC12/RpoP
MIKYICVPCGKEFPAMEGIAWKLNYKTMMAECLCECHKENK